MCDAKRCDATRFNADDVVECSFLVPITEQWQRTRLASGIVASMLLESFGGMSIDSHDVSGIWKNDKGEYVHDTTRRVLCAVPYSRVDELRAIVRQLCAAFGQDCIYFNVAGKVEFVERGNWLWCDRCNSSAYVATHSHVCKDLCQQCGSAMHDASFHARFESCK